MLGSTETEWQPSFRNKKQSINLINLAYTKYDQSWKKIIQNSNNRFAPDMGVGNGAGRGRRPLDFHTWY